MAEGSDETPETSPSEAALMEEKTIALEAALKEYNEALGRLQEAFDDTTLHIDGRTENDPEEMDPSLRKLIEARSKVPGNLADRFMGYDSE